MRRFLVSVCLSALLIINLLSITVSAASNIPIYRKNENNYMKIALTFDDGPHPRYTPIILEILEKYGIKATFFVIGQNADYYPETLDLVVKNGHELGNHTYSHSVISCNDKARLMSEVDKCESVIYEKTDIKTKLFRPPEGAINGKVGSALVENDYQVVLWDIDTMDWAHTPPEQISERIVNNIKAGDIILMHDYVSYNSPTPQALELFIPILLKRGYKFVVVSELLGS